MIVAISVPAAAAAQAQPGFLVLEAPLPSNSAKDVNAVLYSVSCLPDGSCVSVGGYTDSSGDSEPLVDTRSGGTWASAELPVPENSASNPNAFLSQISCAPGVTCAAVGSYVDSTGAQQGLIETYSHGTWVASEATTPEADFWAQLFFVSCTTGDTCAAGGQYGNGHGGPGLLEVLSNGRWTDSAEPLPSDAYPFQFGNPSVSCNNGGACIAVDTYQDMDGNVHGVAETLAGRKWTPTGLPLPADAAMPQNSAFGGFGDASCMPGGDCSATGLYIDSSGSIAAAIDTLSRGVWTSTEAPLPPAWPTTSLPYLGEVSCWPGGHCIVVGSGNGESFIETKSGSTWTPSVTPLPADAPADAGSFLQTSACPPNGHCVALGMYAQSSVLNASYSVSLSNGEWTAAQLPAPSNASPDRYATYSVSCTSAGTCAAVGDYLDTSGNFPAFIEYTT
jgi:hypothetical protein